jgi:hypothetical protein
MKRMTPILVSLILSLLLFTGSAWGKPILVGWNFGGGLVSFDTDTGEYLEILSSDLWIEALAFQDQGNNLYGIVNLDVSTLVTIDPKKGVITEVGTITGFNEITAMTYDETTKTIFALDQTTRTLLSIDPKTANPTAIGNFSFGSSNALAADPITGQLYGSLMGIFGSIDKATGAFTIIGDTGLVAITGLDFDPKSETLYGVGGVEQAGSQLFIIDLATASPSFIGSPNLPQITALEFVDQRLPVPEPATMLLLASGLVGLAGVKKKFRK